MLQFPRLVSIGLALFISGVAGLHAEDEAPITTKKVAEGYKIAPLDVLSISVYGQSELSSSQRVTDKGAVSIPLLGEVSIGGLSISDAQKFIRREFIDQQYLVDPMVSINIENFSPKEINIFGEVGSPGTILIPPGQNALSIQSVIARAGGFTGAASKNDVKVTRAENVEKNTEDSKEVVDVSAIISGRSDERKEPYMIYPDDIVFVSRRLF